METLILAGVGLSAAYSGHVLALAGRYRTIAILASIGALLFLIIRVSVAHLEGLGSFVLAVYLMLAVVPFGVGLGLETITGGLWRWLRQRRTGR